MGVGGGGGLIHFLALNSSVVKTHKMLAAFRTVWAGSIRLHISHKMDATLIWFYISAQYSM